MGRKFIKFSNFETRGIKDPKNEMMPVPTRVRRYPQGGHCQLCDARLEYAYLLAYCKNPNGYESLSDLEKIKIAEEAAEKSMYVGIECIADFYREYLQMNDSSMVGVMETLKKAMEDAKAEKFAEMHPNGKQLASEAYQKLNNTIIELNENKRYGRKIGLMVEVDGVERVIEACNDIRNYRYTSDPNMTAVANVENTIIQLRELVADFNDVTKDSVDKAMKSEVEAINRISKLNPEESELVNARALREAINKSKVALHGVLYKVYKTGELGRVSQLEKNEFLAEMVRFKYQFAKVLGIKATKKSGVTPDSSFQEIVDAALKANGGFSAKYIRKIKDCMVGRYIRAVAITVDGNKVKLYKNVGYYASKDVECVFSTEELGTDELVECRNAIEKIVENLKIKIVPMEALLEKAA